MPRPLSALPLVLALWGCAFDASRDGQLCDRQSDCAADALCFQHLCRLARAAPDAIIGAVDATSGEAAPPPGEAGPQPSAPPPIPGCAPEARCLAPTDDTYTDEAAPQSSHAAEDSLYAAAEPGRRRRIYLRFSLAAYRRALLGARGAHLSLRLRELSGAGETGLRVVPVEAAWPASLTWASAPLAGTDQPLGLLVAPATLGGRWRLDVGARIRRALAERWAFVAFRVDVVEAAVGPAPVSWIFDSAEADGAAGAPWLELEP